MRKQHNITKRELETKHGIDRWGEMGEQGYLWCVQKISSASSGNIEFTLERYLKTIKELGFKIRQASLLAYPDFVICKSFEMCLDILQIRFGLMHSAYVLLFSPKTTINKITTTNKPINTKKV